MFLLQNLERSIVRNRARSLVSAAVYFFIVAFLGVYAGSITNNQAMLEKMAEKLAVKGYVVNAAGSQRTGLRIEAEKMDKLLGLGVEDVALTSELYADNENAGPTLQIAGGNSLSSFSLAPEDVTFAAGFDESALSGTEAICLVSGDYAGQHKIKPGGELDVNLSAAVYDEYGYSFTYQSVGSAKLKIAGTYPGEKTVGRAEIICPVAWMRAQVDQAGIPFFYTSASFRVADPLALNEFKEELGKQGFQQTSPKSEESPVEGKAVSLDDRSFIQSATQIRRSVRILKAFAAPVALMVVVLTALASFLLMRSQRMEVAIARCLGRRKGEMALELLLTNFTLALFGGLPAALLLIFLLGWLQSLLLFVGFLVCALAGLFVSANLLNRVNPMALLTKVD